jgi:chitin synthase
MTCNSKAEKWYNFNLVKALQDTEYISCEINRYFEMFMGTINCLPGAFTIIRYNIFKEVTIDYFCDFNIDTCTLYQQRILGEDRYLTHLIHSKYPRNSIGFQPNARCKTDPPDTIYQFIKQRRRWLLGAVSNEGYMLTTGVIWKKFPLMMCYKIIQTSFRSTTLSQLVVAIYSIEAIINADLTHLYYFFIAVVLPLSFSWIVSSIVGVLLNRYKVIFLWVPMMLMYTFVYLLVDIYAVFTWNKRSWGVLVINYESLFLYIETSFKYIFN